MSNNIIALPTPASENQSPFDAIRQVREDGSEYWSARNLMALMGYVRWEDFYKVTKRAEASARNVGNEEGFSEITEKPENGRPRINFQLSRNAAYLVAMNGDPNMEQVAAAQAYFAIRTREAEVREQPKELTRSDLAQMVLDAEKEKQAIAQQLEQAQPAIQYHHRYIANDDVMTVTNFAAGYGMSAQQVYELMDAKGLLKKLHFDRWSEKKKQVVREHEWRFRSGSTHPRAHWFDLRPQHNAPRHNNGQVRQTLYIRAIHAPELAEFLGLTALPVQDGLTQEAMA